MNQTTTPSIAGNVKQLLTSPSRFFSLMPKSGGFGEPIIFVIAMAVAAAALCALGSIPGQGMLTAVKLLIGNSVLWSIYALLGVFLASAVFFFIWKVLGSLCSYETAFRCAAYTTVMLPVTLLLSLIPVIGVPLGLLWAGWLLVVASTAAHGLPQQKPLLVFGLLALLAIWRVATCDCNDEKTAVDPAKDLATDLSTDKATVTELEPVKVVVTAEAVQQAVADGAEPIDAGVGGEAGSEVGSEVGSEKVARSAEDAGKALGELVKSIGDMARDVGQDIVEGVDNTLQQVAPDTPTADQAKAGDAAQEADLTSDQESASGLQAASETVGETVGALVKSLSGVARDASEGLQQALQGEQAADDSAQQQPADTAAASEPGTDLSTSGAAAMSPEQLGAALGDFINQLNSAASSAAKGFEQGQQANGDASLNYQGSTARDAGEALGRFIRGFNEALRELEAQAPEQQR